MECWEHAGVDAVGLCSRCGKAGCRHCLTMAAGVLFCRTCATQLGAGRPVEKDSVERAKVDPRQRMIAAWVGAAAFAIMGLAAILLVPSSPSVPRPPLWQLTLPLVIYAWIGWSVVWTAPPIFGWLHRKLVAPAAASVRLAQPGCFLTALYALLTVALLWYLLFLPAIAVAMVYGLFGGGIREARRCGREWAAPVASEAGSTTP